MNRKSVIPTLIVLMCAFSSAAFAAAKPTNGFVTVPGGKLFFEERGRGPVVILIHGGFLDHRMWDPQVAALARHYRVIRYDVAGHGQSPKPQSKWNSADHLGLLMKELRVERASIVGLSLGGRIALDFAISAPEKVNSLVLIDPGMSGFPFKGRDFQENMNVAHSARGAGDREKTAEYFMRSWLAGPHRTPEQVDPAVWARVREMILPNALNWDQGSEMVPPAFGRLSEIKAPVLVIEGELDCEDIHEVGKLIERSVQGTQRAVIPGVAHMPSLERPKEVNRLLLEFLGRPMPARSNAADARAIVENTIRDAIGWALTKDQARLESIMAHDADFFIFHPDSKTTVRGYESFAKMIPDFMDPRFVATHFDAKDLTPVFSRSGDVVWFSAMLEDCGTWMGKESCWKETRWTGVLEKREGRWLIVQMHFSFAKDKVMAECPKVEAKR